MPGKIHVPVTVATNGFDKLQRTFGRLKGVAIGVTAALGGLAVAARAIDFTGAAIQGARDLERNYAGLESVFKDNTDQMKAFGRAASDLGLSMSEAAKATTFIGSVLKQSGFALQETSDLTEELVGLGADLALTFGYDIQESLLAMTALFRGEYDPIEKFGVAMKQSEIDAEKLARGLDGVTGAEERLVDQQIRVEFLLERAADAMGAVERQSENLTVQQMRLRAEFENIRDTIAADLLPVVAEFTGGIREIVDDAGPGLERVFRRLAPILGALGTEILPIIDSAVQNTISFLDELMRFFQDAMDPTTDLGNSLSNASEAVGSLGERIGQNIPGMTDQFDLLAGAVGGFADALAALAENIEIVFGPLLDMFAAMETHVRAGTLTAIAAGLVAIKVGLSGIAAVFTKHPILMGLFFGTMALGQLGKQLEQDATMTENYRKTVEDLNYEMLENLSIQEEAQFQILAVAKANGELEQVLRENPEFKALAERLGFIASSANSASTELSNGAKVAAEFADKDGLPAYLDDVKVSADAAAAAARGFKEATLDILQIELRDLIRFGAAEEDINRLRDLIVELKTERGDYLVPDPEETEGSAQDYVGDFFAGIEDAIKKEAARLDLESLGLSEALINQILGASGWEEIFQTIIDGGEDMARQLQDDFARTTAGIKETQEAAEELAAEQKRIADEIAKVNQQIRDTQKQYLEDVANARKEFDKFKDSLDLSVDGLKTYEREIGRFERQTRSDLQRIEQQVQSAFDNGYLLEDARDNLLEYARAEFQVLLKLQQQRDELLQKRNAAADVIFGVAQAITSAGNLTNLLSDVQDKVTEVQVSEVFEDIVKSADGLNGFKVTLERNYTEVVTDTVNKSQALVQGFQAVIDRTRNFIDNLKELRKLGLDPFLFNQLVDAGAEAGGATAKALVEGGADTVNEVNSLQRELEAMGVELGEETYAVTKNSGERFVSGIIDGMDAELQKLEEAAVSMATGFSQAFSEALNSSLDIAFDGLLDGIRNEFEALMAELMDLLEKLKEEQRALGGGTLSYDDQGMPQLNLVPNDPGPLPGPIIVPDAPSMPAPDYSPRPINMPGMGGGGGPMVFQTFVTANNPLDAYNASKGNVEQQANFQSSNGNIQATLTGVGN